MDGNMALLIVLLISIATVGFVVNNWIRMKNGHAPSDDWTGLSGLMGDGSDDGEEKSWKPERDRLIAENRELKGQLGTLQDRMIVLEKIVTDRGYTLADEIEALRDTPSLRTPSRDDSGIPLNLEAKELKA